MQNLKIFIDTRCEVHDLLSDIASGDFADFDSIDIQSDAVYVVGKDTMMRSANRIRSIIESDAAHIVFSNPVEGATTLLGQIERFSLKDVIVSGRIMILSGSPLGPQYRHCCFENFLQRVMNFDENLDCTKRTNEIFTKISKPFKFLMLNGRMRPHRKWMLESLREANILDQGLYTNLHAQNSPGSDLMYVKNGQDLMSVPEPIQYLPPYYEVDSYQSQIDVPCNNADVKHHLFNNEWGEVYIKPEPYIDTYFSLVTETVYSGLNSFRTEKIWKPILMGHPWICVANSGFYRDLRNLGFRTFGSVIDESFDDILDNQLRLEKITAIIKDLCSGDLTDLLDQCKDICKYNQRHIFEFQTHVNKFPQQFVNFLRDNI